MTEHAEQGSVWRRFWNRGGWWRALLITVVYAIVYQLMGLLVGALFGGLIDQDAPFGDPAGIFFGVALPIVLAAALLTVFVWSVGWWPSLLGRQPIAGRPWMWLAVALVVIPIVIRLFATNWSAYSIAVVLTTLFMGLCVGYAEELITRGVGVNLLRKGGYSERVVMLLSSLLFGLLHSTNVLSGQPVVNVAITVVYAFGFGAMMYLSMRVTGSLVYAMLLHAATDPTTFLATGGIDAHGAAGGSDGLLSIAGLFNYAYILFAIVAIFLVKGRVRPKLAATADEAAELG
ncbi:CAAX protease self-immunity [Agromyces sp. CF514]|uniref:CPBP family glutamic-type intramembrane protease n=1 Tax=Agromyces sp. CF514 TaxID=1881031 RepID=UPI0008E68238|nr:CPBP family glutamic-type intramembrane protease [Agromyces sp. CF514]SFR86888.1 CAAX protease self-immunity [Agromyces sp. CF514]